MIALTYWNMQSYLSCNNISVKIHFCCNKYSQFSGHALSLGSGFSLYNHCITHAGNPFRDQSLTPSALKRHLDP